MDAASIQLMVLLAGFYTIPQVAGLFIEDGLLG